ncbi:MAG TPA: CbrC family protein [Xanthobacteraceae bacterium]|jgi:hypothetical protein|nr:CbrC family protein [Xanthobacteraceae bacterium]
MDLPKFKYFPDPVATGDIVKSDAVCECCGKAQGYVYAGIVYTDEEDCDSLCPWCIADGSAHKKLGATFIDEDAVGGYGSWDSVPKKVSAEITQRTPAFSSWQATQWWTHCRDAAQFLGPVGRKELEAVGPDAVAGIKANSDLTDSEWDAMYADLDKDGSPTAYLFRCSKCNAFGGFWDCD